MSSIAESVAKHQRLDLIQAFRHLRPGSIVDLEFSAKTPLRVKSRLIGFEEGKYIIVSLSVLVLRDYSDLVQEGKGCIVRTLLEGEAGKCIAFRSTVDIIPPRPKGLLFIRSPKQIESISLRKENRILTQLDVTFFHREEHNADALYDAKTQVSGQIKDISAGGCRVIAQWPEHKSKIQHVPVYLSITLANEEPVIIKAEIKNQHREDPATVSFGMMFVQDELLDKLLEQLFIN